MAYNSINLHIFGISVSEYGDGIPALDGVKNSIADLKSALSDYETHWCEDKSFAEVSGDFTHYLNDLRSRIDSRDVFIFYYCGHGFLIGEHKDTLLLGTSDTDKNTVNMGVGIKCDTILEQLRNNKINNFIVVLDCCHSGIMTEMGEDDAEGKKIEEIADKLSENGGVIITSTSKSAQLAKQIDINGKKHAAFTHYFANILRDGLNNGSARFSVQELVDEIKKQLGKISGLPEPEFKCRSGFINQPIFKNNVRRPKLRKPVRAQQYIPDEIRRNIITPMANDSEVVFALVGTVGTKLGFISELLKKRLEKYNYQEVTEISISRDILQDEKVQNMFLPKNMFNQSLGEQIIGEQRKKHSKKYKNSRYLMELGTEMRRQMDSSVLALAVLDKISKERCSFSQDHEGDSEELKAPQPRPRHAYIIRSLKHPDEVRLLRSVYGDGFYLFGIYEDVGQRQENLKHQEGGVELTDAEIEELISTDETEEFSYGQQARSTYQLSDFFIDYTDQKKGDASIERILDLIFGDPFITPTFGEYAMFMAWCASLRSADLSRQIGAVVCKNDEVLTAGANDCPAGGGGLYWPWYDSKKRAYIDEPNGRDYMRGRDTNKAEFVNITRDLFERFNIPETLENFDIMRKSSLANLTEYGRVVHAEMEAILASARNHISCRNADLYVTTFPCHVCAKHIIAAGFRKVVYIEAYPKSKTFEFYKDSITTQNNIDNEKDEEREERDKRKVVFAPFFGVGPRRFIDAFAINTNFLPDKKRKYSDITENFWEDYGKKTDWSAELSSLRSQMQSKTYFEREAECSLYYNKFIETYNEYFEKDEAEKTHE